VTSALEFHTGSWAVSSCVPPHFSAAVLVSNCMTGGLYGLRTNTRLTTTGTSKSFLRGSLQTLAASFNCEMYSWGDSRVLRRSVEVITKIVSVGSCGVVTAEQLVGSGCVVPVRKFGCFACLVCVSAFKVWFG